MSSWSPSEFFESRRIGNATVTVICDGSFAWAPRIQAPEVDWRRAMPEADADGVLPIDLNVAHIRVGDASILVDLGFEDQPPALQAREARLRRSPGVVAGLAGIGVRPEQITHVAITHAHGDHFAGAAVERDGQMVARYPRARHLIGRADWNGHPTRNQPGSLLAMHLGTIERSGLLDLVDGDEEIVPGVTMIHAPGESPGHSIVRVRSAGESFYYLGDLFHHTCEVACLDWVPAGRDSAATLASRERLIAEAVPANATMVFTHQPFPAWGRIVRDEAGFRWEEV
ncbi:MAG TPA: MBL fold metallo-hydrolase [Chloroflexota bacterium]|nr:MBL fold metallo-hydrolase [Chloroflexota bacterium]